MGFGRGAWRNAWSNLASGPESKTELFIVEEEVCGLLRSEGAGGIIGVLKSVAELTDDAVKELEVLIEREKLIVFSY